MKYKTMPIRTRIFLNTLGILLLGMGLAAILAWRAVENLYLDTQRENLLAQAKLSATALEGQPLPVTGPYSQTTNTLPGIHTHLLDQQDAVVLAVPGNQDYSSWQDPLSSLRYSEDYSPASLMTRSEIISALKGEPATAVHRVEGRQVLYAAAPIYDQGGAIAGILYLAAPLPPSGLPLSFIAQMIAALGMAVLLALLTGALLSRRLARPLEEAARAAQAVAAGDLDQQLPAQNGIRELRSLEDSFNRMTASLRQSAQSKNAFIADVTHELRTPLTVIKGTIETLEDGALDDLEGRGPLLASMQRESERLIRLVNELLVLTRADAGALQMNVQPVNLAEVAGMRCEACRERVSAALERVPGVRDVSASLFRAQATVVHDGCGVDALLAAVAEIGFPATVAA